MAHQEVETTFAKLLETRTKTNAIPCLVRGYLHCNKIKQVPDWLRELTDLETLYLSENQLNEFPLVLTELKNLEGLGLDKNQISSIPRELSKLTNLRYLYLEGNPIKKLPGWLKEEMPNLEVKI